ncbi:MAG: WecB/TagA/CpsF family glycosyltransferase [Candidatus Bipolaricaulota bacterium]
MRLRTALLGPKTPVTQEASGRVVLLEVPLTPLSLDTAVEELATRIAGGQRGVVVFTPDAHASALALLHRGRADLYREADLVLCDGAGLAWASRLLGHPVPRAPGVDVAWDLCRRAAELNWSVYLLGGRPGVAELAARQLQKRMPGIRVTGAHHGYFTDAGPLDELSTLAPDLLLVGMGCPRQERWILENRRIGAGIAMGVGGALDFWAGSCPRAPLTLRRMGLEWAWRTLHQPLRVRRLWAVPFLLYQAGIGWLRLRTQSAHSPG